MGLRDGQALLDAGTHRLCGCGSAIIRRQQSACRQCRATTSTSESAVPSVARRPIHHRGDGPRTAPATIPAVKQGGFIALPNNELWLVVAGTPVPQGSMTAVAAGVARHGKGRELISWRDSIHRAMLKTVGLNFATPDCPMRLHVCATMPLPQSPTSASRVVAADSNDDGLPRIAPDTRPDLDKLARAVGDALCPTGDRVKSYTDDGRIVEFLSVKSFPAPEHVHPWALPWPGVAMRITPASVDVSFPALTLQTPRHQPQALVDAVARMPTSL